jgi:hypothetical protein
MIPQPECALAAETGLFQILFRSPALGRAGVNQTSMCVPVWLPAVKFSTAQPSPFE